jgi:glycerol-3-phosphate O-acyltransferase
VSAVVLAHRRRGLSRLEAKDRIAFLRRFCERAGARLSRVLLGAPSDPGVEGPIREAAQLLQREGCLRALPTSGEIYFVADPDRRLQLSFHKNNLLHPLVPASLCATALLSFRETAPAVDELRERTRWLSRLFKYEFVYRVGSSFERIYEETLDLLRELGLISPDALHPSSIAARDRLELLRDLTRDFVESYFIAADALEELGAGGLEPKELTKRAMARGQGGYLAGKIGGLESLSRPNFENAWSLMQELGVIVSDQQRFRLGGDGAEAVQLREEIARYL